MSIEIKRATPEQSPEIAEMEGQLLEEIMNSIGIKAFNFDWGQTAAVFAGSEILRVCGRGCGRARGIHSAL
jgi:hypothetical protein